MDAEGFLIADCNVFGLSHNHTEDRNMANAKAIIAAVNATVKTAPD
jgi:hypothetical protein